MAKRASLFVVAVALSVATAFAATPGSDFANDPAYDPGWTDGDDGGTPTTFAPWSLQTSGSGTLGFITESSTNGGGADINTAGEAFSMYAQGTGNFADAYRAFGTPLAPGQTFSVQLAVNFTGGSRGFNLRDGNTNVFNINIASDNYTVSNVTTGAGSLGGYSANTVFSIQLTQTDLTSGTWSVNRTGGVTSSLSGSYTGTPDNFQFYIGQTGDGTAENLYFNNLVVTAIPEPSTVSLLTASAIFGACFYTRRRSR